MKKKYVIITGIVIYLGVFLVTSLKKTAPMEIENAPNWVSIEEARDMAADTGKLIMVDVYEVGCKYCRAMEREVYPDTTVRVVIDQGYIPVKLDGNSEEMVTFNGTTTTARDFARAKGAYAFPTVLVLDVNGDVVKKRTGFMNIDELRQFLYRNES
jgi:thioredoxin-related protein